MPYYAVANGHQIGIFSTWAECQRATNGFSGARFKKFDSIQEAERFIQENRVVQGSSGFGATYQQQHQSSSSSKNLFYAVAKGQRPGIYETWSECQAAVADYRFAKFRKFPTLEEAEAFMNQNIVVNIQTRKRSFGGSEKNVVKRNALDDGQGIPIVYTDGACSRNGTPLAAAGYGVYWGDGHEDNVAGPVSGAATNNRAEYEAVCVALDQARRKGLKAIKICTDSKLLVQSMTNWMPGWKRNNWKKSDGELVLNRDLLERIDGMKSEVDVTFEHVAGHAGIHGNEMADKLAREGARQYLQAKRTL